PAIRLVPEHLREHEPEIVSMLGVRPPCFLGSRLDQVERFPIAHPRVLDDAEHVQHVGVVRIVLERLTIELRSPLERTRAMGFERLIAQARASLRVRSSAAVLVAQSAAARARCVAIHRGAGSLWEEPSHYNGTDVAFRAVRRVEGRNGDAYNEPPAPTAARFRLALPHLIATP